MKSLLYLFLAGTTALGLAVNFTAACTSSTSDGVTDTNTNWLKVCESSAECGELDCLCGFCTRECDADRECAGLGDNAVCGALSEESCESALLCVSKGSLEVEPSADGGYAIPAGCIGPSAACPSASVSHPVSSASAECVGEPPECPNASGGPVACIDGTWICPPIRCMGGTPTCDDGCGGTVLGLCIDGVPTCPDVNSECPCEGEPPTCGAPCGTTTSGQCIDGTWTCPPIVTIPCPPSPTPESSSDGNGGNGGEGGFAGTGGNAGSGENTVNECECTNACAPCADGSCGTYICVDGACVAPCELSEPDPCDSARAGEQCDAEGTVCGGPCTDACSFCNVLRCDGGVWRGIEVFPAPCFDCGNDLRCDASQNYCQIENSEVYSCEPFPEACGIEQTCDCLESQLPGSTCTAAPGNGLVVEIGDATLLDPACLEQCTVTNGSNWCFPSSGFVDEQYPVEWMCGLNGPSDQLGVECVNLPTGAERWCCAETFSPICE